MDRFERQTAQARVDLMDRIGDCMEVDHEFLWGWHCSIAKLLTDLNIPPLLANTKAANYIADTFGADPRTTKQWIKEFPEWISDHEPKNVRRPIG